MTDLRIVVTNDSATGGTTMTPFWFGVHNADFDLFNVGEAASAGLEAIAEDGNFAPIADELLAADVNAVGGLVAGARGPIVPQEMAETIVSIDGDATPYLSLASMVLPSNDAFVGTSQAIELFDEDGDFNGEQTIVFTGENVYDAGTEVNTELDAAFINQTGPNTGADENGVIELHPGFNGSLGNPDGEGDQIILGGINAFGDAIDPVAADFTQPDAGIATVHVNVVNVEEGTDGRDKMVGSKADDIFDGGDGNDVLIGRKGWDDLSGGDGNDLLRGGQGNDVLDGGDGRDRLHGGRDDDKLDGGDGNDWVSGGRGDDQVYGGDGNDHLFGGKGNDMLAGGMGDDVLNLGSGEDMIFFAAGDGHDTVRRFDDDDMIYLSIAGIESFEDLTANTYEQGSSLVLELGEGDSITLLRTDLDDLSAEQFGFV